MKSAVAVTYELDDAVDAARQLTGSIKEQLELEKNSIGILLCDADLDGASVTGALKKLLGIEVVGMTTLATLDPGGRREAAAVLTVLTAEDCAFLPAVSEPLIGSGHAEKIAGAYRAALSEGEPRPAMLFLFCPYGMSFSGDTYPQVLSKETGNAPIMGGVASDDYDYERARVFFSGKEYKDALVLLGVWGNVRPLFSIRHVTSRFAERIRRVTEAEGNVVRKVGGETFVQYLEGFGLKTDVEDPLLAFTPYPMMLTREGGETPVMRHISGLNLTDGTGSFLGDVPTGTLANICLVSKGDVTAACRESMKALLDQAKLQKDGGYLYSTIFCISCCGRAMLLGLDANAEGQILAEMLPSGLTLAGAYCLGEICPTRYGNGMASNRFHNCSITFCMF
ncbi:MAG: FIST C-terminal domain-containing protein [Synergistaceae bacterium]|jgi:hypothetical protein|nr:FIST C-terminal domain-containing protein [Synergistaceae bacterium]